MKDFKIELKRAFYNRKFLIALLLGFSIAIYNYVTNIGLTDIYEFGVQYEKYNMETPQGLFTHNIISAPLELPITLFFYGIIILGALPYADSYVIDKNTGFNKNILSRTSRKNYYIFKWIAVFFSGFITCLSVILFNFLLNMTILPLLSPIVDGMGNSYGQDSSQFLLDLFTNHPILHFLLFAIIISVYIGVISTYGLLSSSFSENRFIAILTPFLIIQSLGVVQKLLRNDLIYLPININTGNGQINLTLAFFEIVTMGIVSFIVYTFLEEKRSHSLGV
ncbi:hypothetical protein [Lagierella sp.]|uniref:hypothetical protein n=1 Tax=Lagierella sp. TaxID=2849657 RepID=UPI0026048F22|nr:hypothetical protein [Lagierella sp.]